MLNKLSKDHIYYAFCLAFWELFGSLVPAICNRTSCAQVYGLPQIRCGDNWEGTFFLWLHIYYANLAFVRFKHSVCHIFRSDWTRRRITPDTLDTPDFTQCMKRNKDTKMKNRNRVINIIIAWNHAKTIPLILSPPILLILLICVCS